VLDMLSILWRDMCSILLQMEGHSGENCQKNERTGGEVWY